MESVYFNHKRITDCILIYKTKSFHVHQIVLILNSKYFENLSEEKLLEPVIIPDLFDCYNQPIDEDQFREFLQAIYNKKGFDSTQLIDDISEEELTSEEKIALEQLTSKETKTSEEKKDEPIDNEGELAVYPSDRTNDPIYLTDPLYRINAVSTLINKIKTKNYNAFVKLAHYFQAEILEEQISEFTNTEIKDNGDNLSNDELWEYLFTIEFYQWSNTRTSIVKQLTSRILNKNIGDDNHNNTQIKMTPEQWKKMKYDTRIAFVVELTKQEESYWKVILDEIVETSLEEQTLDVTDRNKFNIAIREAVLWTTFKLTIKKSLDSNQKKYKYKPIAYPTKHLKTCSYYNNNT